MSSFEFSDAGRYYRKIQRRNLVSHSLFSGALVFLTLILSTTSLSADELIIAGAEKISGENSRRSALYGAEDPSNPLGEDIDLMSGNLGFSHTDLVLRGNGPEIAVTRTWSASRNTHYYNHARHTGSLQDWDLAVPEIETSLLNQNTTQSMWKVVGPSPLSRCSNFGEPVSSLSPQFWWRGVRLKVPGQPEQMLVRREATNSNVPGGQVATYPIVTNNNWAISCLTTTKNNDGGQGFLAISPKGDKYWFDWYSEKYFGDIAAYYGTPLNLTNQAPWDMTVAGIVAARLRVTRIEDRHGNYLLYSYLGGDISRIEASDGRFVNFLQEEMDPTGVQPYKRIAAVQYSNGNGGLQQITYQYEQIRYEDPIRIHRQLKTVTYPDGASWVLAMFNANGICRYQKPPIQTFAYSCYPSSYAGVAGAQVSVKSPSGLNADYVINHAEVHRWAENCPYYGRMQGSNPQCLVYPIEPNANYAPKISRKTYSGPGIQDQIWSYNYIDSSTTPSTVVTNPDGSLDVYKFGAYNKYAANDGILLSTHEGAVMQGQAVQSAMRTTTYEYAQGAKIGTAPQRFVNRLQTEYLRGLNRRVIEEGGVQYIYDVTSRDDMFRPTATLHHNPNRSRGETIEYFDDTNRWVLGQTKRRSVEGVEAEHVEFDLNSMPWKRYQFGKLRETTTYDMSSSIASGQKGTVATVSDGNGNATTLGSWKRGIPQSIKYPSTPESPAGAVRSAVVEDNGWVTSITDENGHKTCYGYDAMGRVNLITYPSESVAGVCDSSAWTPTSITFSGGQPAVYGLPAGYWRRTEATGNARKVTIFDALWRPVVVESYDASNTANTISQIVTRYDASGRKSFQSYPQRNLDPAVINTWANPAVSPNALGLRTSYDALDRVTRVEQDSELGVLANTTEYLIGPSTRITPPKGQPGNAAWQTTTTYMAYDTPSFDLPVTIQEPEGKSTTIVRDVFGKPTSISRGGGGVSATRSYVYDHYQQLCKAIEPETGATVMGYDGAGNLTHSWSGLSLPATDSCNGDEAWQSGRLTWRRYTARNQIDALRFADGRGDQNITYTPDGLVALKTTWNGLNGSDPVVNSYTYNERRLLTGEAVAQPGWYAWGVGYDYDENASLSMQTYPTNFAVNYAPNALGQATQAGTYATGVQYHPNGAIKQFTYGNGIIHTMSQSPRQLPARVTDSGNALDFEYIFDKNGNVSAINDYVTTGSPSRSRGMGYDGLDRLRWTQSPSFGAGQLFTYTYDALDNLKSSKLEGVKDYANYVYDPTTNLLTNIKNSSAATVVGLSYDLQGNLQNKNGQNYSFDFGNRLREVTGKEYYRYDGHGRRVLSWRPTATGAITLAQYSNSGQLVYDQNDQRQLAIEYIYLGGSLVATRERPYSSGTPEARYQHTDALGSPVAVTNSAGVVVDRTDYEPYGTAINKPAYDGVGYTGHVQDAATGLTYMQQRYYDPLIGRFLSVDPVTTDTSTGANFNRYKYANNNPYRFTDPDGRQDCDEACEVRRDFGYSSVPSAIREGQASLGQAVEFVDQQAMDPINWIPFGFGRKAAEKGALAGAERSGLGSEWAALKGLLGLGKGARFASEAKLTDHFTRHGPRLGIASVGEYERAADRFLTGRKGAGVLESSRANGDVIRFNQTTNEFGVINAAGNIKTYFKPDPSNHGYRTNLEYYNAQAK